MSQSNIGEKTSRTRKRDRFQRLLGIHPRSSSPIASDTFTGASTSGLESQAARSPQLSDSAIQFRELIPGVTTSGPLGSPVTELQVPAPYIVVDRPAPPLFSPGKDTSPVVKVEAALGEIEAGSLWAQALNSLSEKDKGTLSGLAGKDKGAPEDSETTSILDIEKLLVAVRAKREMCLENLWEFEFRGRAVTLRDQADKIISWLAKFKEVGDIAIQQDPSHAALPWAGIRFLLQVGLVAPFHGGH